MVETRVSGDQINRMPGVVQSSSASAVFPEGLQTAFTELITYESISNDYALGENQRSVLTGSPRRRWRLTRRLTPAKMSTLLTFFNAHRMDAFYLYSPWDTSPRFSYDPTGAATVGRFKCRFEGPMAITWTNSARGDVPLELVELA